MSCFLGQQGSGAINVSLLSLSDCEGMIDKSFVWDFTGGKSQTQPFSDGALWGKSRMGADNSAGMFFNNDNQSSGRYEAESTEITGGQQQLKIRGNTLNSAGTALGSCIVMGYVTSTNTFVGQCTSDSGGYYELPTPYTGQNHYIVAYQVGSPSVAGTSLNTLTPS
jgi:hypothetical protein